MPSVDFNVLRNETTMEQVLNQLGFQPTSRSANQLHRPCPVHGSTSKRSQTFSVKRRGTGTLSCERAFILRKTQALRLSVKLAPSNIGYQMHFGLTAEG